MGIDEVAGAFLDLGHDVEQVGQAIGTAFEVAGNEIVSSLTSAGVAVEEAVDTAFGDLGKDLSDGFSFVGSSVVSVTTDGESSFAHVPDIYQRNLNG